MRCDWDLILRILLKALSYKTSYPTVFTNGAVYGGRCQELRYNDEEEFAKVFTNVLYIGDYDLAVVRNLGNRAAVAIDRITPKGHTFIDKALILIVIEETTATERAIAKKLNLNQHTVNYYLEQFEDNGFIKAVKSHPIEEAGELEYIDCRLTSKGRAALDNLSLLLDESSKSSNRVSQNYYAPVYGVAGNVQGNQNVYPSEQKQPISKEQVSSITLPKYYQQRLKDLEDNIKQDLALLKDYQYELRYTTDPRTKARYRREIVRQEESVAHYKQDYSKLQQEWVGTPSPQMQEVATQLRQMDAKLNILLSGQVAIYEDLLTQLNQTQLDLTQKLQDAVDANQVSESQMQQMLAVLEERIPSLPPSQAAIAEVIKDPELDVKQRLKVTLPIVPMLVEYEGEFELGSGFNIKSAWERLVAKLHGS